MSAAGTSTLNNVRKLMQHVVERKGFDAYCFENMKLLSADIGRVRGEIPITKGYLNAIGGTHGGWLSTLVDVGGSLAIASHGFPTLALSFLAASGEGSTMGRTLAYTRVDIFSNDKMIATGSHTKFVAKETAVAAGSVKKAGE
ncbi:hypothetical protein BX661DRAFT_187465 [Kickxella alabastrina]|uniref:uncharacterized protein n=1 Tax=Kickxella alabastrina TaxID=61397 RepID=UPI00221E6493|nr:uncharacterized protein BX661DRAFT_187465 [Kickxella alabastrina]KAI7822481.1 hypothetical protein BX661DRAFT_187465 [Kickxella alabastrina]